ncbi:PTS sugar transporter subunit IIA [Aminobacter sp. BE322]|uniref:PTS sugar transporter subunit IIA n=1 Tax=unclassified Aminobacter TaxID=2644704 RepID=UPI003D1A3B69
MDICDVISVEDVVLDLRPEGKTRLLKDLAVLASRRVGIQAGEIVSVLSAREKLGSTGLGLGVAIPHAKMRGLKRPFGLFARLDAPCPFEAIDGQAVDLVVLLLMPEASPQEHLNVLARIARLLRDGEAVAGLRKAADAESLYRLLTEGKIRQAAVA